MRPWITALVAAVMIVNGGCGPIVLSPVGEEPEEEPEEEPGGEPPSRSAIAVRFGDLLEDPFNRLVLMNGMQFRRLPHPDALALFFSDSGQECSRPLIGQGPDGLILPPATYTFWQLALFIPPELNRAGLIDLRDTRITSYGIVWDSLRGGNTAVGAGSGGFFGGVDEKTLEIVSSDASSVSVKLFYGTPPWRLEFNGEPYKPDLDLGGDYTATYCGDPPLPSPPSPGRAIPGAALAAPPGGPTPDPDALHLFLGSAAESCADPWSPLACTGASRVTLSLPPAHQKPGILDLTDPAIAASFSFTYPASADCASGEPVTGVFDGGTIEILSIDASGVSCRVYGSHTGLTPGFGVFDADGLYTASSCR
ncbi:hypothetical protein WMF04_24045 [Sorangium sp. So ce260]|uniref:hypothetical protein n=1 Tax=Sorangium sp. So ce260 TaxID=3133291 RepID=UPI003F5DF595